MLTGRWLYDEIRLSASRDSFMYQKIRETGHGVVVLPM